MARYRKVDVRTYADEKFRALSAPPPNAQTLWIRLLTGEHTGIIPGLSRVGEAALAEQLGWPLAAFRRCFSEITSSGMAVADWPSRLLWLPNAIRYNEPDNQKVVAGWRVSWDETPDCPLKASAWVVLDAYMAERDQRRSDDTAGNSKPPKGPSFRETFRKACPQPSAKPYPNGIRDGSRDGMANKEQEQEQEQEQDRKAAAAREAPASLPESPGAGGGNRTDPKDDAARVNAAGGGKRPAARDGGDAASVGMAGELRGAAGPARHEDDFPVRPLDLVDGGGCSSGPDLFPLTEQFRRELADALARTAPHPVGGGRAVFEQCEAALARIPVPEAVRLAKQRVVDAVARQERQPGTLRFFVECVLCDELTRRSAQPKRRRFTGLDPNTGAALYAEEA